MDTSSLDCNELNTDRARQGVTGHHVRHVLTWGIIGVLLGFAAVAFSA
jgi:hypothetical protein